MGSLDGSDHRDPATVTADGEPLAPLPDGVTFRDVPTHVDGRGSVCEIFDSRWDWHPDPLVFVYMFTLRPGQTKGWGMHKEHEDRYFILAGDMEVVLYDERDDSPTRGLVASVVLSEHRRRLMNVPARIWHANRNLGSQDVIVVNCPTIPYDHAAPDKYRLPLDTDRIPYRFPDPRGVVTVTGPDEARASIVIATTRDADRLARCLQALERGQATSRTSS